MTDWQDKYLNKIVCGDCLEQLKQIPDNVINCCVTSPPYWGLRDYGTAQWQGGDSGCSHKRDSKVSQCGETGSDTVQGGVGDAIYKDICSRCGAIRIDKQLGLEKTPDEYVNKLVEIFREVKRVLKPDGMLWLNLGDTYSAHKDCKSVPDTLRVGGRSESANIIEKGKSNSRNSKILKSVGLKNKDLVGIPWMVAFALRADGWYLRQEIIWSKPNCMPESVKDRCTKSHEQIFLLTKLQTYYFNQDSIKTPTQGPEHDKRARISRKRFPTKLINGIRKTGYYPMANLRSVWTVTTKPFRDAHFATFPEKLIQPMILAGCPENGIVLDPFIGAGTTAVVSKKLNRNYIGVELNEKYIRIAERRVNAVHPSLFESYVA